MSNTSAYNRGYQNINISSSKGHTNDSEFSGDDSSTCSTHHRKRNIIGTTVFILLLLDILLNSQGTTSTPQVNSDNDATTKNVDAQSDESIKSSENVNLVRSMNCNNCTDVYFGVGCFWHVQHEFVNAERQLLNRSDTQLTSRTGYAGGTGTDKEGRVCYHNNMDIADYGELGYAEVVGMEIPQSSIGDFATEYFGLFVRGDRSDRMDRGPEYRSLLGLPNGINNPSYPEIQAMAIAQGLKLVLGKGDDPDTSGTKQVLVYDTAKFPFHQAEIYHQFHNDFRGPPYGKKYNDLQKLGLDDGRLKKTGCPEHIV